MIFLQVSLLDPKFIQTAMHALHVSDLGSAFALFASPKQASAMPARPRPNFLNAARRVTDWAMLLVSSSNLLFILFFRVRSLFLCSSARQRRSVLCCRPISNGPFTHRFSHSVSSGHAAMAAGAVPASSKRPELPAIAIRAFQASRTSPIAITPFLAGLHLVRQPEAGQRHAR